MLTVSPQKILETAVVLASFVFAEYDEAIGGNFGKTKVSISGEILTRVGISTVDSVRFED